MTDAEYRALDAVNFSTLKYIAKSPRAYEHAVSNPVEETAPMMKGSAVHCATFEPDSFPTRHAVWHGQRRGKEWTLFAEANAHLRILTEDEYRECIAIRDAVRSHAEIAPLLVGGEAEVPLVWTDGETGLLCKGRLDYLQRVILDLKVTATGIDEHAFANTIAKRLYHAQLAHYRNGLVAARGAAPDTPCWLIAAQANDEHDVALWKLDEDALYRGEQLVAWMLRRLVECRESGKWDGAHPTGGSIGLPGWFWQPNEDRKAGEGWLMGEVS